MTNKTTKRTSLSLKIETLESLDIICYNLGVSRSGFVQELLNQSLGPFNQIVQAHKLYADDPNLDAVTKQRHIQTIKDIVQRELSSAQNELNDFESQVINLEEKRNA